MKGHSRYFTLLLLISFIFASQAVAAEVMTIHCMNEKTEAQTLTISGESVLKIVNEWPVLTEQFGGNLWACWQWQKDRKTIHALLMAGENGNLATINTYLFEVGRNDCFRSQFGVKRISYKGKSIVVSPSMCIQRKDNTFLVGYLDDELQTYSGYGAKYNLNNYK